MPGSADSEPRPKEAVRPLMSASITREERAAVWGMIVSCGRLAIGLWQAKPPAPPSMKAPRPGGNRLRRKRASIQCGIGENGPNQCIIANRRGRAANANTHAAAALLVFCTPDTGAHAALPSASAGKHDSHVRSIGASPAGHDRNNDDVLPRKRPPAPRANNSITTWLRTVSSAAILCREHTKRTSSGNRLGSPPAVKLTSLLREPRQNGPRSAIVQLNLSQVLLAVDRSESRPGLVRVLGIG